MKATTPRSSNTTTSFGNGNFTGAHGGAYGGRGTYGRAHGGRGKWMFNTPRSKFHTRFQEQL